jgi:hypothetical protein
LGGAIPKNIMQVATTAVGITSSEIAEALVTTDFT